MTARKYRSIEEVRAVLYPHTAVLLRLPPDAHIQVPVQLPECGAVHLAAGCGYSTACRKTTKFATGNTAKVTCGACKQTWDYAEATARRTRRGTRGNLGSVSRFKLREIMSGNYPEGDD